MKIGIYGRDDIWRERVGEIVETYAKQVLQDVRLLHYKDADELLREETECVLDALFLDMDAENQNGIDTAKLMNEQCPECQIIYFSENLNYATEVYSTIHTYFVLKEEMESRIEDIFKKIFWEQRRRQRRIVFSVIGGKKIALCPREILYFERIKRITKIVSYNGIYEIRDKLDSVMERLPDSDFIRCHNSYIVCRDAVKEKQKNSFVMRNGDNVTISRTYVKSIDSYF